MTINFSAPIKDTKKAGRAPYNFVPLADKAVQGEAMAPPDFTTYREGCYSGEILCRFKALTPFYIRGMWDWDQYIQKKDSDVNEKPFAVSGRLLLPGSSIRGMVRTQIEIVTKAPLAAGRDVNDQQLFFRGVGASSNPRFGNSYEPHAEAYKTLIGVMGDKVKCGYLRVEGGEWKIRPASPYKDTEKSFFRVNYFKLRMNPMEYWKRRPVSFEVDKNTGRARISHSSEALKGWLICSGVMPKKVNQWVMTGPDEKADDIAIDQRDVDAYLENGVSQLIASDTYRLGRERRKKENFAYGPGQGPQPCFFIETEEGGRKRISFGHTPFFRLPYKHTTANAIPQANLKARGATGELDDSKWDIAEAMFGRTKASGKNWAGRVFFEDGVLVNASEEPTHLPREVVLGTPKPTTYQHYLVQQGDDATQSIHWDHATGARIRGHKLYWHRPGADVRPAERDQDKVSTKWQPASKGNTFHACIRYENLRLIELGALLHALELPKDCAHHLGMGKPLGLGSFRVEVVEHVQIDRKKRYNNLFDGSGLETGAYKDELQLEKARKKLLDLYPGRKSVWEDPRMSELKALLQFDGLPKEWNHRTRYLEFGIAEGRQVNEYNQPFKRRPLPPATQVLTDRGLPADPRPNFEGPKSD